MAAHVVQDYSDPVSFLARAQAWGEGRDPADRAPLYPILLYHLMTVIGRDWIFLSNVPFLLLMIGLLGALAMRAAERPGDSDPEGVDFSRAAPLAAVCLLLVVRRNLLLQLVNPYREPLTMALSLASLLLLIKGRQGAPAGAVRHFLAGLLLGLAASVRETALLLLPAIGIWLLVEMIASRRVRVIAPLCLVVGLVIGLLPLLIKNYQYSGAALVPAYSVRRVESLVATERWDIPIPGMSLAHFRHTLPNTLRRTAQAYRPAGMLLLAAGLFLAWRRRRRVILYLLFPAAVTLVLFYGFYTRYLARYLLPAEIFLVPIMAYGAAGLLEWASRRRSLRSFRLPRLLPALVAGGLFLWTAAALGRTLRHQAPQTKVWHLPAIRETLLAHTEQPATFLGHRHFCFRMAWLLNASFFEFTHLFQHFRTDYPDLDARLREQGEEALGVFAEGHYYMDTSPFALGRNWLQQTPVFDFADMPVPFTRYGRPLTGRLSRVHPWEDSSLSLRRPGPRPDPALLLLDLKRPWDYPGRTFLRGSEPEIGPIHPLTNAVQWIVLSGDPAGENFEFRMESDAPLPPDPFWRLVGLNEEIRIAYGMAADHWAWNQVSDNLFPNAVIPLDACQVYDRGTLRLPVFASPDHDVFARLRVEFIQEHPSWRQVGHALTASSSAERLTFPLPPRRSMAELTILLGAGSGALSVETLELETSLPAHAEQTSIDFARHCKQHGFVKLYDVRIASRPRTATLPIRLDVGSENEWPQLVAGFHGRERPDGRSARWTGAHAAVRALLPEDAGPIVMRWHVLPARPDMKDLQPEFSVNGHRLDPDRVAILRETERWTVQCLLPPEHVHPGAWNTFAVTVPTFNPARDTRRSRDQRDLGLYVEQITFDRLQ